MGVLDDGTDEGADVEVIDKFGLEEVGLKYLVAPEGEMLEGVVKIEVEMFANAPCNGWIKGKCFGQATV